MKLFSILSLALVIIPFSYGSTHLDIVKCELDAKVSTHGDLLKPLPKKLSVKLEVFVEDGETTVLSTKKYIIEKSWNRHSYVNILLPIPKTIEHIFNIEDIDKYTTNNFYVNKRGIHNNRVKEFEISFSKIPKDEVSTILREMGLKVELTTNAKKDLKLKNDTEFTHKPYSTIAKFKEQNTKALFTLSCSNSIQLNGQQFL